MLKFNVDGLVEKGLVKKKTYTEGKYKGILYVLSLVYYQDIPQYNIIEVGNNNKLFL